jgi:hypothetical protein
MAETAVAEKTQYQGQMHLLQKELMGRYFERVTRAAEKGEGKAVYMLISGNPVELIQAFDLIPVYPEIDALQLAVKKSALPFIQKAEELGYSMDNCAYVKADVGMFLGDRKTPFATIPLPSLILCNYVGCNVYLQWFEHLAEYCDGELYNLDIPFLRDPSGVPSAEDVTYVVRQLEELVAAIESDGVHRRTRSRADHIQRGSDPRARTAGARLARARSPMPDHYIWRAHPMAKDIRYPAQSVVCSGSARQRRRRNRLSFRTQPDTRDRRHPLRGPGQRRFPRALPGRRAQPSCLDHVNPCGVEREAPHPGCRDQ